MRMRVQLLGTGSSDGWPNPWCACPSCQAARGQGVVRSQTSALVDGRLLIELGHDGMRSAAAQPAGLSELQAVLVTHAHPDHHAWPAWMWRRWAGSRRPLTLVAPPAVLADAVPHLDDAVTAVAISAGETVSVAGYEVLALPATHGGYEAGPAVLYDLTDAAGGRLLWATDTGTLSQAALALAAQRAYDAVLLDLTSAHLPDHHDLMSWPRQVDALRACGAIVDTTQVFAIHLGHDNPPPDELDTVLAGWGAQATRDGQLLDVGSGAETVPR